MNNAVYISLGAIAAVTLVTIIAGLISKQTLTSKIEKMGLEYKDNILVNKLNGKKYSGSIKYNVGSFGFNNRETSTFADGIIMERTNRDLWGREIEGVFYKNGKECMQVQVSYPLIPNGEKAVAGYLQKEDGSNTHYDLLHFKGKSAFEWVRKIIKQNC